MTELRKSATVVKAQADLANLKFIDPELDFGDDLSIAAVVQLLEATQADIEMLNANLKAITQARRAIRAKERTLKKLIERLQHGITLKYGKDSEQHSIIYPTVTKRRKPSSTDSSTADAGSSSSSSVENTTPQT